MRWLAILLMLPAIALAGSSCTNDSCNNESDFYNIQNYDTGVNSLEADIRTNIGIAVSNEATSNAGASAESNVSQILAPMGEGGNASQEQGQDNDQDQSLSLNQTTEARNREAHSAIASALVANGCFGSVSGGGQGTIFGFTIGKTYESENCIALRTASWLFERMLYYADMAGLAIDRDVIDHNLWMAEQLEQASFNALCGDEYLKKALTGIRGLECEETDTVETSDDYTWLKK